MEVISQRILSYYTLSGLQYLWLLQTLYYSYYVMKVITTAYPPSRQLEKKTHKKGKNHVGGASILFPRLIRMHIDY